MNDDEVTGGPGSRPARARFVPDLSGPAGDPGPLMRSRRPPDAGGAPTGGLAGMRLDWVEVAFCLVAFAVLCVVAFSVGPQLVPPDDYAYQGSIIALSHGHLTLSDTQSRAVLTEMEHLDPQLGRTRVGGPRQGPGIPEWHREKDGNWISEKNPGYPFLAIGFYDLGIIRLTPLFYGLLACAGLYFGARQWLRRRFAGAAAVALFCSSGAAAMFACRAYIPTFTDASLLAAGSGAIVWAVLATEASARRRTIAGLLGFLALEAAAFTRYSDILVLGVAVVAVLAAWRWDSVRLPAMAVWWWLGSAVAFVAGMAAFDGLVYGSPTSTGYAAGEITFSLSAVRPNLRLVPRILIQYMPMLVIALAAAAWITARYVRSRRSGEAAHARRDLAVATALAVSWLSMWGLYLAYTWTALFAPRLGLPVSPAAGPAAVRFYLPALGAMALLGAWVLVRLPHWLMLTLVAALYGIGYWSFASMPSLNLLPGGHPGTPPPHGPSHQKGGPRHLKPSG